MQRVLSLAHLAQVVFIQVTLTNTLHLYLHSIIWVLSGVLKLTVAHIYFVFGVISFLVIVIVIPTVLLQTCPEVEELVLMAFTRDPRVR